jgi:hypothetical protein
VRPGRNHETTALRARAEVMSLLAEWAARALADVAVAGSL